MYCRKEYEPPKAFLASLNKTFSSKNIFEADLQGANLQHADLTGAIFDRTNLYHSRNANFDRAYLDKLSIDVNGLPCLK